VWVIDGETSEQSFARYAEQRGITMAEVHGTVFHLSEQDAKALWR